MQNYRIKAIGLVEILLAMSLFMMYAVFLIGALSFSIQSTKTPNTRREAINYAEEGIEVVRYLRKSSLANIADGTYGVALSAGQWTFVPTNDVPASGFVRSIVISSIDTNTKKIIANVNWNNGISTGTESLTTLITNWNAQIIPPFAPWQTPVLAYTHNATENYQVQNLLYSNNYLYLAGIIGTFTNAISLNVTNPASIITSANVSSLSMSNASEFNGNKLHMATTNNTSELVTMNYTSPSTISTYGTFNLTGNQDATGVAYGGNYVYITRNANGAINEFHVFTDNLNGTFTLTGQLNSAVSYFKLTVLGNYAYVATNVAANDVAIVNITNKAAPAYVTAFNTPSAGGAGTRLFASGNYLYVFTSDTGVHVYNISNPTAPTFVSTYNTAGAINGYYIDQANNRLFLATANATQEFQVLNISNLSNITLIGSYNAAVTLTAITYDPVNERVYAGTGSTTQEIIVFSPQ